MWRAWWYRGQRNKSQWRTCSLRWAQRQPHSSLSYSTHLGFLAADSFGRSQIALLLTILKQSPLPVLAQCSMPLTHRQCSNTAFTPDCFTAPGWWNPKFSMDVSGGNASIPKKKGEKNLVDFLASELLRTGRLVRGGAPWLNSHIDRDNAIFLPSIPSFSRATKKHGICIFS